MKDACSRWIGDPFDERGEEEVTAEWQEGRHRAKPFRASRVSEIRHRANFPKAERWLSPRRVHGQSRSKYNFSAANRVPPASWELPPRASTTTLLRSLFRDSPSALFLSPPFLLPLKKRQNTVSHRLLLYCTLPDWVLKHFLSSNIWKCEKIA